jgi:lysophospholipase L1-like esterase
MRRRAARYLIVQEGINDIGVLGLRGSETEAAHRALVESLIGAYEQIVLRAHARGVKVFGGTLSLKDRDEVNQWIRTPGHFDAVIDFDKAVRDPKHPERLLSAYDSGDPLHPSPAGYCAMAAAVPLTLFER